MPEESSPTTALVPVTDPPAGLISRPVDPRHPAIPHRTLARTTVFQAQRLEHASPHTLRHSLARRQLAGRGPGDRPTDARS
jgi:integrase